jgi:hypothetical protein
MPIALVRLAALSHARGTLGTAQYERLAGIAAYLAGFGGFVYSVAFIGGVVLGAAPEAGTAVASSALLVGGLLTIVVLIAVYGRVRAEGPELAILGLAFSVLGAMGASVHGGYDLSNVLHPPITDVIAANELPSAVDPRGLLTFGFAGLGVLALSALLRRSGTAPRALGTLGMVLGALLVVVYLGRLVVLDPTNPLVAGPAALVGFVLSPVFYLWLGTILRRRLA